MTAAADDARSAQRAGARGYVAGPYAAPAVTRTPVRRKDNVAEIVPVVLTLLYEQAAPPRQIDVPDAVDDSLTIEQVRALGVRCDLDADAGFLVAAVGQQGHHRIRVLNRRLPELQHLGRVRRYPGLAVVGVEQRIRRYSGVVEADQLLVADRQWRQVIVPGQRVENQQQHEDRDTDQHSDQE